MTKFAVALVHHPVKNRLGETTTTAITSMDIHDFLRTAAFFDVAPVYIVHPAAGMHAMVEDIAAYWLTGAGGTRNPLRKEAFKQLRLAKSLAEVLAKTGAFAWYTSANPPVEQTIEVDQLAVRGGKHLLVFGTGWGLDESGLPEPAGWLSPIVGTGKVRHLSVRAALAIYLDRLRHPRRRN